MGKEDSISNSSKIGPVIACIFLTLPFIIFSLGWIRIYYAIPILIITILAFCKSIKHMPSIWIPDLNQDNIIKIIIIVGVLAIWIYYSGIGKFVYQNDDHIIRNTIFNLLIEKDWPIRNYHVLQEYSPGVKSTGMVYYIGFWFPAAVIGKLFGLRIGYYALAFWALIGLSLVYYFICARYKKILMWPLFIVIFFSGCDILGVFLSGENIFLIDNTVHLERWSNPYQFSSMTTQLFWVFNQAVPAWVATALLLHLKDNKIVLFIAASLMISSTFPFVGFLALVLFLGWQRKSTEQVRHLNIKRRLQIFVNSFISVPNIIGGGTIGIISFIYLIGNTAGTYIMKTSHGGAALENSLPKYGIFILLELFVFALPLYSYNKNNRLFYFIIISLCIIPPVKIGYAVDFCMRASIPGLFVLMILVIDALIKSHEEKKYHILISLIVILTIGSITPLHEMARTITNTFNSINSEQIVYARDEDEIVVMSHHNFAAPLDDNFFYKYISK